MRIGIGLPAAVPGTDMTTIGGWAAAAELAGFASVGVIDRLVYDNLDPLTALSAAAATTGRVELLSTVINVGWRNNPRLLAKQLASVQRLAGGRLTAGLGIGGWPADFEASAVPLTGRGARYDEALAAMREAWQGDGPRVLLGGTVPAAFARAARSGSDGWVAPLFGHETFEQGAAAVRERWRSDGRAGAPRIVTGRYFALGPDADAVADDYIHHYYGADYFPMARTGAFTSPEAIRAEQRRLDEAGCDDLVWFPCTGELDDLHRLAAATSPHSTTR